MQKNLLCWHVDALRNLAGLFATICFFQLAMAQENAFPGATKPLSPTEALAAFQLAEPDLKIELAAAEPEVVDPVAIRFDERGRMWVAEMGDYPLGPPTGEPPLSRIKVLTDEDADGIYEKATLFADKLSFVTGLQPWRGGVIVTLAGRIAWMKDTNNDGRMDVDETWYTGFAEQNSQLRANHPRLALDNHVYVANGLRGGVVVNKRLPNEPPINLQGRDFRFDPLTGKAESISGNGQFGMCFDDWGNRFTCTNRNPVIHVVLEDRYLKLAPKIPIPAVVQDVAAAAEKSKVFPISRAWTTSNLHAGTFTAACGVHVYRGDTLREVLGEGSVFTCDPTGNFVHREIMKPDGPSFTSKPAYDGKEFLASTDEWFRPVNVETGPDGCLYIVDMYRCVIEHPDFVPDELKKRPDLRLGDDRGRIWRIAPRKKLSRELANSEKLEKLPHEKLPWRLECDEPWRREAAHRLLLQGNLTASSANLVNVAILSDSPLARVHAMELLRAAEVADAEVIRTNLQHKDPRVRQRTLLYAEALAVRGNMDAPPLIASADRDENTLVRWQAMLSSIPKNPGTEEKGLGDRMELDNTSNRWLQAAVSLRYHGNLADVYASTPTPNIEAERFLAEIVQLIGSRGSGEELKKVVRYAVPSISVPHRDKLRDALILEAFAKGLLSRGKKFHEVIAAEIRAGADGVGADGMKSIGYLIEYLFAIAEDTQADGEYRAAAVRTLGYLPVTDNSLMSFINSPKKYGPELQVAAIASLAQRGAESQSEWLLLLAAYEHQPLGIKRSLIDNSFRRADGPKLLLEQVKAGVIQAAEIDPLRRKSLLESKDAAIKKLAEELFAALNPANRQQALDEYQAVLKLKGDSKLGAVTFEKNCSTCHRVGEIGVNVAPDISDTRPKTAAQLLGDIIQPNRAIDSNFIGYQLLLKDGTAVSGLLAAETSTSLTVKQPGGKVLTIARDDVEQLKATGVSLMPDGLEKNIPPQAMADLLSYLKNWRYLDGKTPLAQ